MSRYKVISEWGGVEKMGSFYVQEADIQDTRTGTVYSGGASRVVDANKDMKPAKTGKGGTVPFYGETAWSDARRLMSDLALAERFAR